MRTLCEDRCREWARKRCLEMLRDVPGPVDSKMLRECIKGEYDWCVEDRCHRVGR